MLVSSSEIPDGVLFPKQEFFYGSVWRKNTDSRTIWAWCDHEMLRVENKVFRWHIEELKWFTYSSDCRIYFLLNHFLVNHQSIVLGYRIFLQNYFFPPTFSFETNKQIQEIIKSSNTVKSFFTNNFNEQTSSISGQFPKN